MRKPLFILMFLVVLCLTFEAWARICLLSEQFATGDCIVFDPNFCDTLERVTPCADTGVIEYKCTSEVTGQDHYYCDTCEEKAYKPDIVESRDQHGTGKSYKCEREFGTSACGCSVKDTKCNTDVFPIHANTCEDAGFKNSDLTGRGRCYDPNSPSTPHLSSCECDKAKYPFTCAEDGFRTPASYTESDYCIDSSNHKFWSHCDCDDSPGTWVSKPCSERVDGCTAQEEVKVSNAAGTAHCYHCHNETCVAQTSSEPSNQLNLEVLYCKENAEEIKRNCAKNGTLADGYIGSQCCAAFNYSYVGSGTCKDGSVGPICPFDKNYMFCQAN